MEYSSTFVIEQLVIIEAQSRVVSSFSRAEPGGWHPPVVTVGNGVLRFPSLDINVTLDEIYQLSTLATTD